MNTPHERVPKPRTFAACAARSMKITEDVRRYAKENAIDESSAIEHGLRRKAEEFSTAERKIYSKP